MEHKPLSYDCLTPGCFGEMQGGFTDTVVTCPCCGVSFDTDWDYTDDYENFCSWITGVHKKNND